jgi:hypothetical protein
MPKWKTVHEVRRMVGLTWNGKALVVTLLFRLLFGGYLVGKDQFYFNDFESALTVLLINVLLGLSVTLFLLGRRYGLIGVMGLSAFIIISQSIFLVVAFVQPEARVHDPLDNWWAILLYYLFSSLAIVFSIRAYREA